MTSTKDQEREALKKIRQIVEALGADSYVAIAFEGCFEDAEENIENDFALSMKERFEEERKRSENLKLQVESARKELEKSKAERRQLEAAIQKTDEQKSVDIQRLEEELEKAQTDAKSEAAFRALEASKNKKTAERVKELEQEVVCLKARLYDFMVEREDGKK